ncbi:MAG TPA: hypothetical protein PK253_18225 [Spirochaetota bacterium]|nr:hypothetical protein [Spirochaetota bacterium]
MASRQEVVASHEGVSVVERVPQPVAAFERPRGRCTTNTMLEVSAETRRSGADGRAHAHGPSCKCSSFQEDPPVKARRELNFKEILKVNGSLHTVYETINRPGLVPDGF